MTLLTILLQAVTLLSIATSPAIPEDSPNIHLSEDKGKNWTDLTRGLEDNVNANDIFELEGTLYLSTSPNGLYRMELDDDDRCWEKVSNGLPEKIRVRDMERSGNYVTIATFEKGIYFSNDGGYNWQRPFFNIDGRVTALLYTKNGLLAASSRGIFLSIDHGQTWQWKDEFYNVNDLVMLNGQLLAIGHNRIGVYNNGNIEWSNTLTTKLIRELLPLNDYLYFRTLAGEMFRTKDGLQWEKPNGKDNSNNTDELLPEALFRGYESKLPQEQFNSNLMKSTSLGWISIRRKGC